MKSVFNTVVAVVAIVTVAIGVGFWWNPLGWKESRLASVLTIDPHWHTCQVTYRIDRTHMPANGDVVVRDAVTHVSQVTGVTFTVDATLTAGSVGTLVFTWTPAERNFIEGYADAVGITHNVVQKGVITSSEIQLAGIGTILDRNPDMLSFTVKHELGHLFGLEHNDNPESFMFPLLADASSTELTESDVALLRSKTDMSCATPQ